MTKEEAIHEIEKVFEPAFANYIITALTEGATSSDEEQQFCEDKQDCEHCIHTYGTLGCCDMVNNKWIYDCDFGREQYRKEHGKPCEDVLDKIIAKIEQTRDKDKIAEYPYNRCIRIIEGYIGESEVEE